MNDRLEDLIRRSAGEQGKRYRPATDIAARVDQRRRQRTARRMTAAGVGLAAIVGVIGFAAIREPGTSDLDVAAPSTSVVAPASTAAVAVESSIDRVATTSTTGGAVDASTAAATTPPALHPETPPAYAGADGAVWPYGPFWRVPRLGTEGPVRGTGCGSIGEIGEVIPDGLFAGFVTGHDADDVAIDLLCIYDVPDASALPNAGAIVVSEAPNYVIINNNSRARTMPMDASIVLRLGVQGSGGECVDGTTTKQWSDIPADRQVWVRIHDGKVTWVFADCA